MLRALSAGWKSASRTPVSGELAERQCHHIPISPGRDREWRWLPSRHLEKQCSEGCPERRLAVSLPWGGWWEPLQHLGELPGLARAARRRLLRPGGAQGEQQSPPSAAAFLGVISNRANSFVSKPALVQGRVIISTRGETKATGAMSQELLPCPPSQGRSGPAEHEGKPVLPQSWVFSSLLGEAGARQCVSPCLPGSRCVEAQRS